MSDKYQASGVSLDQGYEVVSLIKKHIVKTRNKGFMESIGGFGGLFDLSAYHIKEPVLVSGTDGVGTKLMIAQMMNKHDTIGIDLVAMCVNDIITVGAKPLFFLDYIATHKINPKQIESLVKGMTDGCILSDCALIGGETAEMNDLYGEGEYDLAGYTTGVAEKKKMIHKEQVKENQVLIGLASSGIHSNGYSLVRKIFFKDHDYSIDYLFEELGKPLGEVLLEPTVIYVNPILNLIDKGFAKGIAHITGGGFIENIPRMLPEGLGVVIEESALPKLPIFQLMERLGEIDHLEMYNIFNMGIGMVVIVDQKDVQSSLEILSAHHARVIGHVVDQAGVVIKV